MWALGVLNPVARINFSLAKDTLTRIVIAYSKTIEDNVFLVLDGYKGTFPYTQRLREGGIEVVITAKGLIADQWIIDTISREDFQGKVVTSDREIIRAAERRNVPVTTSGSFEKEVMKAIEYDLELMDEVFGLKREYQTKYKSKRKNRFYR